MVIDLTLLLVVTVTSFLLGLVFGYVKRNEEATHMLSVCLQDRDDDQAVVEDVGIAWFFLCRMLTPQNFFAAMADPEWRRNRREHFRKDELPEIRRDGMYYHPHRDFAAAAALTCALCIVAICVVVLVLEGPPR